MKIKPISPTDIPRIQSRILHMRANFEDRVSKTCFCNSQEQFSQLFLRITKTSLWNNGVAELRQIRSNIASFFKTGV